MPPPNAPPVQQYFDELIQQLGTPPIACGFAGEHRGKAIYAERAINAGELIFSERPFVAMQHEDNKDFADCCEHCFVPLINSKDAWERVEAATLEQNHNDVASFDDFEATVQFLQKEGGKSDDESYFSVFRVAKHMVACTCGVLYCSDKCKQAAWHEQHAFLCPRADDNATPMGHFVNHTLATNEIFQLAGKVIATILARFVATHDLAFARQPVDMFCKMPWWDVVVHEEDVEAGETLAGQRDVFKALLQQTLDIFLTGLEDNVETMHKHDELNGLSTDAVLGACAEVLTVEFFGCVVGMFEMNNMSMEIDHPFHTISEALLETVTEGKKEAPPVLVKVKDALEVYAHKYQHAMCEHDHGPDHGHDHHHHHDHDHAHAQEHAHGEDLDDCCEGEEEDFVGVEGTALFPTICTMNHDCDPNCTVIYMKDGTGHVYAVQDIHKGDELRISYIDVDQSVEDRELSLREYQFKCRCARCEEERHA